VLNLDPAKLLVIAVVAVILLGPDRLPQVARQVGAAWRSFNEFRHRMETEVRSSIPDLPSSAEIARLARSPSALLNHLSSMDGEPNGSTATATPTAAGTTAGTGASPPTGPAAGTTPDDPSAPVVGAPTSADPPGNESSDMGTPAGPTATATPSPTVTPNPIPNPNPTPADPTLN
jgi:sec-independent protein translocase protein TatB